MTGILISVALAVAIGNHVRMQEMFLESEQAVTFRSAWCWSEFIRLCCALHHTF